MICHGYFQDYCLLFLLVLLKVIQEEFDLYFCLCLEFLFIRYDTDLHQKEMRLLCSCQPVWICVERREYVTVATCESATR